MKLQLNGMAAALGLALSVTMVSVSQAQARTAPRSRSATRARALPPLTVRSLVTGMAEMDPQAVKLDLGRYRVVQAGELLEAPQLERLVKLVDDNSTARRNQNLVTTLLRRSRRLSPAQTVVGADFRRRQLFVVDNRVISPTNGIR